MIHNENTELDGIQLIRYYSDANKKIRCNEDGNIYPTAYTAPNSTLTFSETDIPLNDVSAGPIIDAKNIKGLDAYISSWVDLQDNVADNQVVVNLGGVEG